MKKAFSETGWGYLFVGPTLLGYLVFVLGPLIAAIVLSFTHYDMMSAPRAVGLKNYVHLATDPRLLTVYRNTALFALVSVGLGIPIFITYLENGIVPRLPTAVFSMGLMILAMLSASSGLVLDTVTRGRRELKLLAYLSQLHSASARESDDRRIRRS